MFICVSRLTLAIPESGSLKAKRQILRRVTDRLKARFNVAVAEVEDNDLWQKATLALAAGERCWAEAGGMGVWEERHERKPGSKPELPRKGAKLSLEEARARARGLRNPRE